MVEKHIHKSGALLHGILILHEILVLLPDQSLNVPVILQDLAKPCASL